MLSGRPIDAFASVGAVLRETRSIVCGVFRILLKPPIRHTRCMLLLTVALVLVGVGLLVALHGLARAPEAVENNDGFWAVTPSEPVRVEAVGAYNAPGGQHA